VSWRSAATDTPTTRDNRDICSGLGHHTFETVQGSLPWRYLEVGRPASKAGPTLVREQPQPMTQPGLRRLCAVDAHSAKIRSQTASADPTLHAQLHRATVFPARNGPRGPHVVSADDREGLRFAKNGTLLKKTEKVGNSVPVH